MIPKGFIVRLKQSGRSLAEAFTACSIMMVQGNFSAFTLAHAGTALATGLYTAIGVLIALSIRPNSGRFFRAWVTGVVCMFADRFIHPPHFGEQFAEAFFTGLGAFFLAIIFDLTVERRDD